jgi:glycosyltransferase involved in cell wall biosynthesis
LQPRKNLSTLFEAWSLLHSRLPDIELAVVGTDRSNFAAPWHGSVPPGVRFLGSVQDAQLPDIYSAAAAVVVPSLYEGFGLTALEGMACGTPAIVASGTALDETVGTAALKVDARSASSIAEGLERIITDDALRSTLQRSGMQHARTYTWERTAEATWRVLQEAAGE